MPPGVLPVGGNTQNFFGAQAHFGQAIGDFQIKERLRYQMDPNAAAASSTATARAPMVGSAGLELGWRFRPSPWFHIVPSIGVDAYGGTNGLALSQAGLGIGAGGGLSFEWWWAQNFAMILGGDVRYGIPGANVALIGTTAPQDLGLMYSADLKFRWYLAERFAIQFGGSAWSMPRFFDTTAPDLLIGPNLGIVF